MTMQLTTSVLAVDVGSSRVKLGWFPAAVPCAEAPAAGELAIAPVALPAPNEVFRLEHIGRASRDWFDELAPWLDELSLPAETACVVGSVHERVAEPLRNYLAGRGGVRVVDLAARHLPIAVHLDEPERVGIDRLLGALAVNRLRRPDAAAIAVDMGTATTVDLIAADGAFEGGAIVAGPTLALGALHSGTASLPRLDASVMDDPPPAVGKSTSTAMAAGAYWGAVGAARELIERIARACSPAPEVFLTGGAAPGFTGMIGLGDRAARHVPHMVLSGIRVAADGLVGP